MKSIKKIACVLLSIMMLAQFAVGGNYEKRRKKEKRVVKDSL